MTGPILLIDDSEADNLISRTVIECTNNVKTIIEFLGAEKAIEYLRSIVSDSEKIPELIFLDINMPLTDGFGFLEKFNALPEMVKRKIKIIMLSSRQNPMEITRAMAHPQVIKFLYKPLSPEKLVDIIPGVLVKTNTNF